MSVWLSLRLAAGLVMALAVSAAPIDGLSNSGPTGWEVFGGSCPLGASNCNPGEVYLGSPAAIPVDATIVQPNVIDFLPDVPYWNTTPLGPDDDSVWMTPSVRSSDADGPAFVDTVRYLQPDVGGTMDFGMIVYEYRTSFSMVGRDLQSAYIDATWWADGRLRDGCSVQLNTECFDFIGASHRYFQDGGNFIRIDDGFIDGDNILSFFVQNGFRETGLRVYFDGQAEYSSPANGQIPEPATWLLMAGGFAAVALKRYRR
jgi:hypothetical protein